MSKHRPTTTLPALLPPAPAPAPDPSDARRAAFRDLQRRMELSLLDKLERLLECYPEPNASRDEDGR